VIFTRHFIGRASRLLPQRFDKSNPSHTPEEKIEKGIQILGDCLKEALINMKIYL
jgi:hypothetical protein